MLTYKTPLVRIINQSEKENKLTCKRRSNLVVIQVENKLIIDLYIVSELRSGASWGCTLLGMENIILSLRGLCHFTDSIELAVLTNFVYAWSTKSLDCPCMYCSIRVASAANLWKWDNNVKITASNTRTVFLDHIVHLTNNLIRKNSSEPNCLQGGRKYYPVCTERSEHIALICSKKKIELLVTLEYMVRRPSVLHYARFFQSGDKLHPQTAMKFDLKWLVGRVYQVYKPNNLWINIPG